MKFRALLGLTIVGLAVVGAQATEFYTVRTTDRMLQTIDTGTLQVTDVGLLGVPFDFGDLAWDSRDQKMYMVQGFAGTNLYTVSLSTGAATLVGSHGSTNMFGLTYDTSTGRMFGGESTGPHGFFEISTVNGNATLIGDPGVNLDGLMYDPQRDLVVGAFAGPGSLWSIDRSTGQATQLTVGSGFFNNCGIGYDPEEDMYWVIDWSGNLYKYDPSNGYARTTMLTGLGAHDGLVSTAVPEPLTVVLLALGGMLLLRRR